MKARLTKFLKSLLNKGIKVKKDKCSFCKDAIEPLNENEYFYINSKVFCALSCYYQDREVKGKITVKKNKK